MSPLAKVARTTVLAATVAAAGAAFAAPARAVPVTVQNGCYYDFDKTWGDADLTWDGTLSPNPVNAGATVTSTGASFVLKFPENLTRIGYAVGLLHAGENDVPVKAWAALAADNTTEGVKVVQAQAVAHTKIVLDQYGGIASAEPITANVPLPDAAFTAANGSDVGVGQATGKRLSSLSPAAGVTVQPKGSLYLSALLNGQTRFDVDCQPGRANGDKSDIVKGPSSPFATVPIIGTAAATTGSKPVVSKRAVRVKAAAIPVRVQNADSGTTLLRVQARTSGKVAVGTKKQVVPVAKTARKRVAGGKTATFALKLTAAGKRLLKTRSSVKIRISVHTGAGADAARVITLRR